MLNDIIQKAGAPDFKEIAGIIREDLGFACTDELVRKKLSMLDDRREIVYKAVWEDRIIGMIHIEKHDTLYAETTARVLGIGIKEEYRGQGIGSALMTAAEEWAEEVGAETMTLESEGMRFDAHEFFRSVGYGVEKSHIHFMKQLKRGHNI